LFLNGIFVARDQSDPAARALEQRGRDALENTPDGLRRLPTFEVPLLPYAPMGIQNLRAVFTVGGAGYAPVEHSSGHASVAPPPLADLVDQIEAAGHGVVMTMGKGGVGKTTVASAIAVELAHRGHRVHLSTTDPAAHLMYTIGTAVPGLSVSRIDPAVETRAYTEQVMAKSAPNLDEHGRALLEEDLRSPCTEEIAVFSAFAKTVARGENEFVVLDTAPTGHTLLLLDAAESYHREVSRTMSDLPEAVRHLLPRLRDAAFTRVLLVALPEATPVHEAARLQDDLLRAGIKPFAWVVNQSFSHDGFRDPVLVERGLRESQFIAEVRDKLADRFALVSWKPEAPVGLERLRTLASERPEYAAH
jgi:arsenite-transporting ATPase